MAGDALKFFGNGLFFIGAIMAICATIQLANSDGGEAWVGGVVVLIGIVLLFTGGLLSSLGSYYDSKEKAEIAAGTYTSLN